MLALLTIGDTYDIHRVIHCNMRRNVYYIRKPVSPLSPNHASSTTTPLVRQFRGLYVPLYHHLRTYDLYAHLHLPHRVLLNVEEPIMQFCIVFPPCDQI